MQLAAYADQLRDAGIPVQSQGHLILGTKETTSHDVPEAVPAFYAAPDRFRAILEAHRLAFRPAAWGDERWVACLKCADCKAEMEASDDPMLVRRNRSRRAKLFSAGIITMAMFAAADLSDVGIKMDPL